MGRTPPRNFIRAWRKHRHLSLEKLSARVGTTHGSLSRVERGLQPYNQNLLESLATELGCTPADLLIRNPHDPEGIWAVWDNLSPPERRQAVALLAALKSTA